MGNSLKTRAVAACMLASIAPSAVGGCAAGHRSTLADTPLPPASTVYRLGLGDKVRISIYGEPQLSGEFQVSGTGVLSLPLIGEVKAVGLTAHELEDMITRRYAAGYLRTPRVSAEVFNFRPFSVIGEIARPGQYPTNEGLTLVGAIALAGGYTYRANTKRVFIRRAGETAEHEVNTASDPVIAPGDVVRVGERYF